MDNVEKSVAEQLKEMMDASVALKADKSDLEGIVKSEQLASKADKADLEGVVKSAELEEMKAAHSLEIEAVKTEMNDKLEAVKAMAPALEITKGNQEMKFEKFEKSTGEKCNRLELAITKAVGGSQSAGTGAYAGASVGAEATWIKLAQFNPFRDTGMVMSASSGSFKIPQLSGIAFASDTGAVVPVSGRTDGSTIADKTVVIENWSSYSQFSRPSLEDIDGIRGAISDMIVQQYSVAQATDAANVLKSSRNAAAGATGGAIPVLGGSNFSLATGLLKPQSVATGSGGSAGTLTGANIVEALVSLMGQLDVPYRTNAAFHVSTEVYGMLSDAKNTNSRLEFDPTTGITRLFGYPVILNSYVLGATTAADVPVYFGSFGNGLLLAERRSMSIDEFDQTTPGYNTYFAEGRFKSAIWDQNAIVGLQIVA